MFISILIFIITLLILVLIHEFGHFIMAKRFGIKVEEFGFGIPPRIWGKKWGETLFSINWIPFGGFVKLFGEDEVDKGVLKNPRSFATKPPWQRILVVVAGVVMNLSLAWVIFYTVLFSQNFRIIYPTLEPGTVFVGAVVEGFPAQKMGINIGDRILEVDGKRIEKFEDARNFIQEKKGKEVELKVSDIDGESQKLVRVTPKKTNDEFLIGVGFSPIPFKQYTTFNEKLFSGITYSFDLTRVTFVGLGRTVNSLISGDLKGVSQSVAGPVGIAGVTNNILSIGPQAALFYLWFVGVLSLTLAIFNVLPVPALDGGRLFFILIEAISGRKVKAEVERVIHSVGFIILITLAILITYSDIRKMLP